MIQHATSPAYDLIVVGSGATGGWVAKRAAEAGLRVALVEAGRKSDDTDYREHVARPRRRIAGAPSGRSRDCSRSRSNRGPTRATRTPPRNGSSGRRGFLSCAWPASYGEEPRHVVPVGAELEQGA